MPSIIPARTSDGKWTWRYSLLNEIKIAKTKVNILSDFDLPINSIIVANVAAYELCPDGNEAFPTFGINNSSPLTYSYGLVLSTMFFRPRFIIIKFPIKAIIIICAIFLYSFVDKNTIIKHIQSIAPFPREDMATINSSRNGLLIFCIASNIESSKLVKEFILISLIYGFNSHIISLLDSRSLVVINFIVVFATI